MSDTNVPGRPGEPEPHRGDDLMADLAAAEPAGDPGTPRRVIGTPSPAQARSMLPAEGRAGEAGNDPAASEAPPSAPGAWNLPAEPEDLPGARRAERWVAGLFILSMLAGLGFIASYVIFQVHSVNAVLHSNLALGSCMAVAFLAMGAGAVIWVRRLMPEAELTEERHELRSTPENRAAFAENFQQGAEASQFVKRPIIRRTLIAATVPVAVAPIILLRDAGPLPRKSLEFTVWKKGIRLVVYGTNRPLTLADFDSPGASLSVIPEGYADDDDALAKAATTLIRMRPGQLQAPTVMNWTIDNVVAYSKICTHLGCPAALYEQTTHHILCPCHQSTFDAAHGARVIFGPATRPLPQLPITVNSDGYLIAQSDYHEPVGPSYWERS